MHSSAPAFAGIAEIAETGCDRARICYRKAASLRQVTKILRPVYFVLGLVMLALGLIGIVVPLMPTTIFLILAAWCFARSSKRAEAWLLNHRYLGPAVVAWRQNGAIARKHKLMAVTGMAAGFLVFFIAAHPGLWLALGVGAAMLACALFVVSRPEPN